MLRGQTDEVHARHGCPTDHSREGRAVLFMRDQNSPFFCFFFPGSEGCIVINNIIIIRINIKDHCFSQAN